MPEGRRSDTKARAESVPCVADEKVVAEAVRLCDAIDSLSNNVADLEALCLSLCQAYFADGHTEPPTTDERPAGTMPYTHDTITKINEMVDNCRLLLNRFV